MIEFDLSACVGHLPPKCRNIARNALLGQFEGYSRLDVDGNWRDSNGKEYPEPMDRWEVATSDPQKFVELITSLGREAGELAVYVTVEGRAAIIDC